MFHRVKPEVQQNTPSSQKVTIEGSQIKKEKIIEQAVQSPVKNIHNSEEKMNTMNENKSTQQDVNSAQEVQAATAPANSYQRSNQAPVQSYAPSYSPASSYSTSNASESAATVGDRRLTIGAGITMSGEIESCDYLLVEGTVEAALKGASMLEISESGTFYGTVEIGEAVISGRFEGDITVTGRLLVRAGGVITGAIAYGQLEIEAGAIIDGRLTPVVTSQQTEQQQQASSSVSATSAKKVPASHDAPPEPANTEGNELFSKTAS